MSHFSAESVSYTHLDVYKRQIARFIAVSADIDTYVGGNYDYGVGSAHYNWVQARIQEAKASGMWVIVVNHTPIMNTGGSHGGTDYSTVTPVSYTHLDVYKRQLRYCPG